MTDNADTGKVVSEILIAMLTAASTIGSMTGLGTVVIAAMSAGITLLKQYDDVEELVKKLKDGDEITTNEVKEALTKALAADDELKLAIEKKLAE